MPAGVRSIIADIQDEKAVADAIAADHFDVVAQFIGYTAADVERDIRLFRQKTKQYIYISSASAYQKPSADHRITESTPLTNPYWQYSRHKIALKRCLWRLIAWKGSQLPSYARAILTTGRKHS
ncbi:mRNA-binding protein [Bacteroides reticulotermitis JCM 10512]|uniref:mRNA-binding protein n=1 Tax=Bacteroides reticulotermitis JCM 10512 TaxID=1445607 RepID=W4US45_9BACE|nr:mRNA-binding protein [Bacteroides reticulotermitis JCM 10512]